MAFAGPARRPERPTPAACPRSRRDTDWPGQAAPWLAGSSPTSIVRQPAVGASVLPALERFADLLHDVGVGALVPAQPGAHPLAPNRKGAPRLSHGLREALPPPHPLRHGPAEEVGRDPVVVVSVARPADPLEHS